MTQIQFYHLTATPFERALPKLLEKALSAKYRVQLVVESDEKAEFVNQALWTANPGSFLPHGSAKDNFPEMQPIYISTDTASPNNANLLFITEGTTPENPADYERILDMFDGHDAAAVASARTRWKQYKDEGHTIAYFSQKPDGGWEQKAG